MPTCVHLGDLHARGDHPDVYHCRQLTVCTLRPSELKINGKPVQVCGPACPKRVLHEDVGWMICPKRGDPVGKLDVSGCGCDPTIYACPLHGHCVKRLPSRLSEDDEQLQGVMICETVCQDWKSNR